jgi:hypothetical protein
LLADEDGGSERKAEEQKTLGTRPANAEMAAVQRCSSSVFLNNHVETISI